MGRPDYGAAMEFYLDPDPSGADPCEQRAPTNADKDGAPQRLEAAAKTFRERNALYGDNWLHFGVAMKGIFPHGMTFDTVDEWNRLGIIVQCVAKLTRYGIQFPAGGHLDSAHDMCVYSAMLEELTERALKAKA